MRIAISFTAALLWLAPVAAASPLSDALARHDAAAVDQLRAQRTEPVARCTLGAVYARRGDLARAGFYLAGCDALELPAEIADDIEKIGRDVTRQLRDSELSSIEILGRPEHLTVESTALPGEPFTTPATLWVKAGSYEVRASHAGQLLTSIVTTKPHARSVVWLDAGVAPKQPPPHDQQVTFDENAAEPQTQGPPPPVKRGSLMSKKLRGEVEPAGTFPVLDDPLAAHTTVRAPRAYWLGLRIGGGMFDDGEAAPRAGIALAAAGRFPISGATFFAGRLDWSRRGGDTMDSTHSIDVAGASAGAGVTIIDRGSLALALIGQLRGDLRLASTRLDSSVRRAGLSAAAGLEVAMPGTPITAGFRFEQGLTELVPGARDRAILIEVGVDWR